MYTGAVVSVMFNRSLTTKRVEEIQALQEQLQSLANECNADFASDRTKIEPVIEKDLLRAIGSLELLKRLYDIKTEKPRIHFGD